MPTLVIGYSVEWTKDRAVTSQFLTREREVHERAEAPCYPVSCRRREGWQEAIIRKLYGWDRTDAYLEYVKADADEVARREGLVWSYWAQDWSVLQGAPEMDQIAGMIRHAQEIGINVVSQQEAYREFTARTEKR